MIQQLYHELRLDRICKDISDRYKFTFNLDSILSRLIYGRILFPHSKLCTSQLSRRLLEQPDFEVHQIYRALEVISKETDFIQKELYKNSIAISKRNDRILYYDCTNYFFEIEQEQGIKQYGPSKEHRPNPIVEMGLFMDGDGIPLAFSIHKGNTNEQLTLKPLEEQLLRDLSTLEYTVSYTHGYCPVRLGDCVRLNYERAGITNVKAKVISQTIKCTPGCSVTEKAVFTKRLWG